MVTGLDLFKERFAKYKCMQECVARVAEELLNENFLRAAGLGAQRVEGLLEHPLERWYYGHFHNSWHSEIDGVWYKMLDIMELLEVPRIKEEN